MMLTFVYVKTNLHPVSHILPMDINELRVSPARIYPSLFVSGNCSNAKLHSLVNIILPPFGNPTVIVGFCMMFVYEYFLVW